jgi:hypothetical protein
MNPLYETYIYWADRKDYPYIRDNSRIEYIKDKVFMEIVEHVEDSDAEELAEWIIDALLGEIDEIEYAKARDQYITRWYFGVKNDGSGTIVLINSLTMPTEEEYGFLVTGTSRTAYKTVSSAKAMAEDWGGSCKFEFEDGTSA